MILLVATIVAAIVTSWVVHDVQEHLEQRELLRHWED